MIETPARFLLFAFVAAPIAAQDIPVHLPVTPVLASRSAIYAQPLVRPHPGWRFESSIDYSSVVDVAASGHRELTLDAELMTVDFWVRRDLSPGLFLFANVPVRGAYAGALDEPINSYHHFTGLLVPARDRLPVNKYDWHAMLPDTNVAVSRPGTFLGDIRLGAGWRKGRSQFVATVTLPSATIEIDGWARQTIGTSFSYTTELLRSDRWTVEAGGTYGWTPSTGALAAYQKQGFFGAMAAARWRFSGRQVLYTTLWLQAGAWQNTGFRTMDNADATIDFGGLLTLGHHWPELRIAMTEDLYPNGPAVDVGFRLGIRW